MGNPVTRIDRARVALNMKNAGNKYVNTKENVFSLARGRAQYNVATICLIYNATGDTITLRRHFHKWGKFESSSYPRNIPNGQWAAFLYGEASWPDRPAFLHGESYWARPIGPESETAVLYRGKNEAGQECDWLFAWSSPCKAYTEIKEVYYFKNRWNEIGDKLDNSDLTKQDEWNGCLSYASIESTDEFPVFEAILTLKNA
ncbi:23 kDa jasmonate-induced protein-like [Diospyros lotus]|uniref:23 kDa jasmonate-induced protein-like n=1 Tax=Diospyros lotus TaxID=55363 RepID=UPI00224F099E|nr:23 kDa jasmonate-induced protein-like [Diospyros lotus]